MNQLNKKKYALVLGLMVAGVLWIIGSSDEDQTRVEYEKWLANHSYNIEHYKNKTFENTPDRPDLANLQNFMMTLNPELGRPTSENLPGIIEERLLKGFAPLAITSPIWEERGPDNVGGRTRAIMWDPNDVNGRKVWAGGVAGGLWYNNDIFDPSEEWQAVDDFWSNLAISCMAYDPNNPQVMYVGTGEGYFNADAVRGAGIWKTTDGGANWAQLPFTDVSTFHYVQKIVVTGSSTVLAATRTGGVARSTDGGDSFITELSGAIGDLEIAANGDLYASIGLVNITGSIHKSTDDGETWTNITPTTSITVQRIELATAPSNSNVVYALTQGNNYSVEGIYKTSNGGTSWSSLTEPEDADTGIPATDFSRGQAWYDLILAVDPNDENIVLTGAIDLFKSVNGGSSWQQLSHWYGGFGYTYVHADQHAIAFQPGSSSNVIFGHDGGVTLSTNIGAATPSLSTRNNGYNVTQFYACAIHPTADTDFFLAGAQDNGTQRFNGPGMNSTAQVVSGDGAYNFISQSNPDVQIASYVYNNWYLSTNGGQTFSVLQIDNSGRFINPADYDDNFDILYSSATDNTLARLLTVSSGASRDDISISLGNKASHVRVSPHTLASSTVFVGTGAGRLFKITNAETASPTIDEITSGSFPNGYISCVEIGETEDDLLVTFSNYGVTSVWTTDDGGTTWSNKEGNLPDMPVRWALYNPNNWNEAILATELGIYQTDDITAANPVWNSFNDGLANVRVDMLQLRASDDEVIAATHGRGLYSSPYFSDETFKADFSTSENTIGIGETISFTDQSIGNPISWNWTFDGGTPSSSTDQNPTVTYNSSGTFDVVLTISDGVNNDTRTALNLVTVQQCNGTVSLTSASGNIVDGSGANDYQSNLSCNWVIAPSGAESITLSFNEFDIENNWDYLRVYAGGLGGTLIAELTGTTLPSDVTVNDGVAALVFTTDANTESAGWDLDYTSSTDPGSGGNNAPVMANQNFQIDENSTNNTVVGTVQATDADNDALTFSISSGNGNNAFSLSSGGIITVANSGELDYETTPSFSLGIQVTDGTDAANATVTINLNDVSEIDPPADNEPPVIMAQTFSVDENSLQGATIGTIVATDPDDDPLSFSISAGNIGSAFSLTTAGLLTVNNPGQLDFETMDTYVLVVAVSDGSEEATANITVNVIDAEENLAPTIEDQNFSISEQANNGTIVGQILANDPNGDDLSYTIVLGDPNGVFAISSTGTLILIQSELLDFVSEPTYSLLITVSDGELSDNAIIRVSIDDPAENTAPEIDDQEFQIEENAASNTTIGVVEALDSDGDALSYNIIAGNEENLFEINNFGDLKVMGVLDFETLDQYNLSVQVNDGITSNQASVTVNVLDVDEEVTALDEPSLITDFKVYPNPVESQLNMSMYLPQPSSLKVTLYDVTGATSSLLFNGTAAGQLDERFNVDHLKPGLYLLVIQSEQQTTTTKIAIR